MKGFIVVVLLMLILGFGTYLAIITQDDPTPGKPPTGKSFFDLIFKDPPSKQENGK